jgi:cytochrome c556
MTNWTKTTLVLATLALMPGLAGAADNPGKERHELMESMGDAAKPLGGMLKGEVAFDAATVMESLRAMQDGAAKVGGLFPEGSYEPGEKKASEAVWTDRAGFDAQLAKFAAAVDAAVEANPQSVEALKPVASEVFANCKGCHEDYRTPGN